MDSINVFVSYSKADFQLVESILQEFIKNPYFVQNGSKHKYNYWWDHYSIEGKEWKKQIIHNINECDVFLCMLTENFISSEFIIHKELPLALERQKNSGIIILGILLQECNFEQLEIKKFEIVPKKYGRLKPLLDWKNKKEAITYIKSALKIASISSLLNLPVPLKEGRGLLAKKFRTKHDKQFLPKKEIKGRKALDRIDKKLIEIQKNRSTIKVKFFRNKRQKKLFIYALIFIGLLKAIWIWMN